MSFNLTLKKKTPTLKEALKKEQKFHKRTSISVKYNKIKIKPKDVLIVVPVYNALGHTKKCIRSVLADIPNYDFNVRLLVINDASESKVLMHLRTYLKKDPAYDLITFSRNKGFVDSVNAGIVQATDDEDVILLNSDTVISKNWINKLRDCAYSSPEIGFVGPVSNHGWNQSIQVPDDHTVIDEIQGVMDKLNAPYINTYVALGFCLYARRDALKSIGLMDRRYSPRLW